MYRNKEPGEDANKQCPQIKRTRVCLDDTIFILQELDEPEEENWTIEKSCGLITSVNDINSPYTHDKVLGISYSSRRSLKGSESYDKSYSDEKSPLKLYNPFELDTEDELADILQFPGNIDYLKPRDSDEDDTSETDASDDEEEIAEAPLEKAA